MSADSLPVSKNWLADGIKDFTDEKIMGVYGMMEALPDGSVWEKLMWNRFKVWLSRFLITKKLFANPELA